MKSGVFFVRAAVALCFLSTVGCPEDSSSGSGSACDAGVLACTSDETEGIELCVSSDVGNSWEFQEFCADGEVCVKPLDPNREEELDAMCVAGSGGSGGTAGAGGEGGTAGTGGAGGGVSSCAEINIPGEPNLTGPLSVSPAVATFDDFVTVTAGVDGDTQEVTVILRNSNSDIVGGTGFATTGGNETVQVDVLVGTVADPGPHVVDLELRADASNRVDYVLYTSGDGDNYVRINVENNIPGPETETTCVELNCDIQF
jgi:hypothetical protein